MEHGRKCNCKACIMSRGFFGPRRFLSNYHLHPVVFDGYTYPANENAFQAAKTLNPAERELFQDPKMDPHVAKKLGRMVALRPDWEQIKIGIMFDLNRQKFMDPELRKLLLATGEEQLEEHNWWNDKFWGIHNWVGRNELGKILMIIRKNIRDSLKI